MSLIKIAQGFNPLPFIAPGLSVRAAKSGNPLKYFTSKSVGPVRKNMQRVGLAGLAHMEANLRKGMVQDSTKWRGAIVDGIALGQFGRMGGTVLEEIHHGQGLQHKLGKRILRHAINDNGTYNIKAIENGLKAGHKIHNTLDKAHKIPTTTIGTLVGGVAGYAKGEDGHKKKSVLRGALIGGAIGGSLRKGMDFAHSKTNILSKAHDGYFSDNYWRSQLEAANKPFYNKAGKHLLGDPLTSDAASRAKRMAASDKWQERGDKFWKIMHTDVKDLWKPNQS